MAERASHPLFARVYTRVAQMSERRGGDEHRRKLLAGLQGRVVEVGAGSGANFRHYPAIERAGFQIQTFERFPFSPASFLPPDPHILGIARRPTSS